MDVPQQILEAATRLIAERGFEGTSLAAIAEAVGIRKASLLYHFPSKEALRLAVLDRLLSHWNDALPQLLLAAAGTGLSRFEALLSELIEFFSEDRDRARLLLREMLDRPEAMREYFSRSVKPWITLIGQQVELGQRAGRIRADVDPEAYVLNVIGLALVNLSAADVLGGLLTENSGSRKLSDRYVTELVRIARTGLFEQIEASADALDDKKGADPDMASSPPETRDREVV